MINTKYLKIEDFAIVDVASHCDWKKLNIAIEDMLNFDLPEYLCDMYGFANYIINKENPSEEELKIINGSNFECQNVTKRYLGLKRIMVYYSYANYLMNSTLDDTGLGFVQKKNDGFSTPTPMKDVKEYTNSYRNRAFSVIKQLREYLSHNTELAQGYNIKLNGCSCGYGIGKYGVTEKRIYTFNPMIIKKKI